MRTIAAQPRTAGALLLRRPLMLVGLLDLVLAWGDDAMLRFFGRQGWCMLVVVARIVGHDALLRAANARRSLSAPPGQAPA
jgi:hypothetical protein